MLRAKLEEDNKSHADEVQFNMQECCLNTVHACVKPALPANTCTTCVPCMQVAKLCKQKKELEAYLSGVTSQLVRLSACCICMLDI